MSVPQIPGYIGDGDNDSLDALWVKPAGSYPPELWPSVDLSSINRHPSGWFTVLEHTAQIREDRAVRCVLIPVDKTADALETTTWIGRDLGEIGFWQPGGFEDGLSETSGLRAEFFVQARHAVGRDMPHLEISYPFLWYWDAYEVHNGWKYLNSAGRECELVRYKLAEKTWKVEVKALEFRTFLATTSRTAVVQLDNTKWMSEGSFDRVDDSYKCDWAHFEGYS